MLIKSFMTTMPGVIYIYSTNVPLSYIILYIYLCIAARVVQSLASSEAMQGINTTLIPRDYPGLCDDVVFDSDAYWSCYVRHLASSCFHYSGTCRMGSIDDPTTVVDPTLRYGV